MGVPDSAGTDGHVRKKQRLSLKLSKKKTGSDSKQQVETVEKEQKEPDNDSLESESKESLTTTESTDTSTTTTTSYTDTTASSSETKVPAVASLENFGNTCFMNSIMQVLRYTPGFLENLASVHQNIATMEKIKKKTKSKEEEPQKSEFEEENQKNSWNVVKTVYKVYRDQSLLEERYEEIASDDVMSMAVKPLKVLKAIRLINPMYEGNMQHDAQEFLRCFLAYLQDAEKEIRIFSASIPHTVKAKAMNPLMQKFLQLSNKEKIVSSIDNDTADKEKSKEGGSQDESTDKIEFVEKVKVNLFKLDDSDCKIEKVPENVRVIKDIKVKDEPLENDDKMMPKIGKTAEHIFDDGQEDNTVVQSANVPVVKLEPFSLEHARIELKEKKAKKLNSRKEREYSPYKIPNRKTNKDCGNVKSERDKPDSKSDKREEKKLKQPSITDMYNRANKKKRLGMSRSVNKPVCNGIPHDELNELKKEVEVKEEKEDTCKVKPNSEETINNTTVSDTMLNGLTKSSDDVAETKSDPCLSHSATLLAYSNFLSAIGSSADEEVDTLSESDDEQALIKEKLIAKHIHESPRRSPRKMESQMIIPSPVLINKSVFSRSEPDIRSAKTNLNISFDVIEKSNENQSASSTGISVSHNSTRLQINGEKCVPMDVESPSNVHVDSEITFKVQSAEENMDYKMALEPVIKLEKCDYLFDNNEKSVSASYATKYLSPYKKSPAKYTNNYLKKRNLLDSMGTCDTEELEKALEAMFNSPVKSNSKCDFVERLFQGTMMLRTRCMSCETSTERQEDFHDISVPVRIETEVDSDDEQNDEEMKEERCSLLDLIEASTEVEKLQDDNRFYCDKCLGYEEAERSIHYDVMPDILTLHLKRFYAKSGDYSCLLKINDAVDIPLMLSCLRYKCPQSCLRPDHRYKLYGIITHTGVTLTSGHYMAYVKARQHKKPNLEKNAKSSSLEQNTNPSVPANSESQSTESTVNSKPENDCSKSEQLHSTRGKSGIAPKLPPRFDQNVITDTKVKAFANIMDKSKKKDSAESLQTNKMFDSQWFECDDETVRVFEESEFKELLSKEGGSLLGTPYLLFYHKSTLH